jgi:hypothetical protein
MELKRAELVIKKALEIAKETLGIEFVEYTILDGNKFQNENTKAFFERYYYLIKFNKNLIIEATEEEILIESYKQVRHAYQQVQIEFRDKLLELEVFVEDLETIKCWEEELSYYSEDDDVDNDDFIQQNTEIDSFAFAKILCDIVNGTEIKVPNIIEKNVNERVKEILGNGL